MKNQPFSHFFFFSSSSSSSFFFPCHSAFPINKLIFEGKSKWIVCFHNMYICFVVPPRNLMIDIQKDTAVEGEEIEVNCTAMASKPATTIRWFKGNKELKGKPQIALFGSD